MAHIYLFDSVNVLNEPLQPCSLKAMTGYFKDGSCNTGPADSGGHTICAVMTRQFLDYSRRTGNDLEAPVSELGLRGLNIGDRWCIGATEWLKAYKADRASPVVLASTHVATLEVVSLQLLKSRAIDML